MLVTDLLPTLQSLPHSDKIQAVQFLVSQLEREEVMELLMPPELYPRWSPFNAIDAAEGLLKMLADAKQRVEIPHGV
jgi:hypothetical protein